MEKDLVAFLMSKLTGGWSSISLRANNPFYERKFIEDIIRDLPAHSVRMTLNGKMNPLELFGWYVLDDHAKGYTGKGLMGLIQQYENEKQEKTNEH